VSEEIGQTARQPAPREEPSLEDDVAVHADAVAVHVRPLEPEDGAAPQQEFGTWSKNLVASWLADHQGRSVPASRLLNDLCERLVAEGIPLFRVNAGLHDAHPQVAARGFRWERDKGIDEISYPYVQEGSEGYHRSPVKVIHDGASALRRRIELKETKIDFPVVAELRELGATDYLAMALPFADGTRHFMSWSTDRAGGFSNEDLARLHDLMPLIGLRLELEHARLTTRQLLTTYLGRDAADRVVAGVIRRGQTEAIHAIILYTDMRDFTALSSRITPEALMQTLGIYYETVAEPIRRFGGDIVKLVGDGILTVFPVPRGTSQERIDHVACGAAAATRHAMAALEAIPAADLPEGVGKLRAGFSLHAGDVFFGNVGSTDRLDFTVIGSAVNEAVRAEDLTKSLRIPMVATSAFAGLRCSVDLVSVGKHRLRGVAQPIELFTLKDLAPRRLVAGMLP